MSDTRNPFCTSGSSPPTHNKSLSEKNNEPKSKTKKQKRGKEKSNNSWCTPESLLVLIREFFGGEIDLDPCSNEHATVHAKTEYRLPTDGLAAPWFGKVFVNPPYGKDTERKTNLDHWVRRCVRAHQQEHAEVITLIPASPETQRWHKYIFPTATAFCYPEGRVEFVEPPPERKTFHTDDEYEAALDEWTSPDRKGSSPPMACALVYWGTDLERFARVFGVLGVVFELKNCTRATRASPRAA
jgi:hypothetical protein